MVHLMWYFVVILCDVKSHIPIFDVYLYNTHVKLLMI